MEFHEANTPGWFTVLLTSAAEAGAVGRKTATEYGVTGGQDGYKMDIKSVRNILLFCNELIKNFQLHEAIN
jgi:hypothetical protein